MNVILQVDLLHFMWVNFNGRKNQVCPQRH
jgi:hypothetical protein